MTSSVFTLCNMYATTIVNSVDDCDWTTPCSTGVCFANGTGCPVSGVYLPTYIETDVNQQEMPEEEISDKNSASNMSNWHFITLLVSIGLLLFVIIASILITLRR